MTRPDRIPCLRAPKGCRRTGSREKFGPAVTQIICGKCWRAFVPTRLRRRDRMLNREIRRLKRRMAPDEARIDRVYALIHMNWVAIRLSLIAPAKPAGLDAFLEEAGL